MILPMLEERFWLLHNLALGLVRCTGVVSPPVPIQEMLENPPSTLQDVLGALAPSLAGQGPMGGEATCEISGLRGLPLVERRYALAKGIVVAIGASDHGWALGLADFLAPDLIYSQDYFARVLLAPDHLVEAYRRQGKDLGGFAETFLIPPRVAFIRWMDPLYL